MSIHHFTVVYDTTEMKWSIDEQVEKPIYLPDTDEWIAPDTNSDSPYLSQVAVVDKDASTLLQYALNLLNTLAERTGIQTNG